MQYRLVDGRRSASRWLMTRVVGWRGRANYLKPRPCRPIFMTTVAGRPDGPWPRRVDHERSAGRPTVVDGVIGPLRTARQ